MVPGTRLTQGWLVDDPGANDVPPIVVPISADLQQVRLGGLPDDGAVGVFVRLLGFIKNEFELSGVGIIAAGAVVLGQFGGSQRFLEDRILAPPIVLIVAGAIVFLVAFLGCCGAIKENYLMLIAFAGLLLVIFIIELAVGIAAGVAKDDFSDALRSTLRNSMVNYTRDDGDRLAWDNVQRRLECCGTDSFRDWQGILRLPGELPYSCCVRYSYAVGYNFEPQGTLAYQNAPACHATTNPIYVWQYGCFTKLEQVVRDSSVIVMGVGIGIAFIEIAGIVLACCLASAIKKRDDDDSK
ncbi:CD63 antigen [Frankliniella fusca]|uniref:CD63 antigen n=1 Tax=Frankliniella fusca TaxID=407009 RepID=A0AAE1LMH2_9NEOP|nr:CD63 antigen [Frankliniella fusca]